ncbi:ABC transporter permease [Paeniglutamicibacter cryotolerans]|uniref:ABC-2 type transport system permease protein n=1 Tax=Paeniglutamicibacter cryotolerans TaxID=670079 RepID=A0A839QTC5_9MICC|nr:ABC transporter permease [Paeniglutamicibacter cryotolerans]MBB2995291.1 ABC-2 type transport system permease protein [Paeniglutamicibacter cryotolerans]
MSTATARTRQARRSPALAASLTGFMIAVLFIARRNWLRLLIWAAVLAAMIPVVYDSQQQAFPTQAARDAYAQVANTPAVAAMTGLPYAAGSLGGILVIKIWMTLAVALAFASVFLVTRNGRADEETGRTELLRASVLGRHAYSLANYAVASALSVVVGVLISVLCLAVFLPVTGSLLMGASIAGTGLAFVGISAICGQLSSTSRGANSLGVAVLAVFYFIRAGADLQSDGSSTTALSWFSPIGWAQNMRAFGEDNWWPLLALLALAMAGCALALLIETNRDLGMGLLPERRGAASASGFLTRPVGLALRLQRSSLLGWLAGAVVAGAFFGGVAKAMSTLLDPSNAWAQAFVGSTGNMLNGVLSIFVLFNGMLAGAFAVQCLSMASAEEASGRLEPQLAGALSRSGWLGAHVLVAALGSGLMLVIGGYLTGAASAGAASGSDLALASLAYWPAVLLILGLQLFLHGFVTRHGVSITWAVYGVSVMVAMFGELFSLSERAIKSTPFGAVPRLPAEAFSLTPLLVLIAIAVVLAGLGIRRFATRDIVQE